MSKNQKKKKNDSDIDLAKEDEKLKKLLEQTEELKNDEIEPNDEKAKANLFSQDLFAKAQTKKKEKKAVQHENRKKEVVQNLQKKLNELKETTTDSAKEGKSDESEEIDNSLEGDDDEDEDEEKDIVEEENEEVEMKPLESHLPKKARPMVTVQEKSSERGNICLAITILVFTGFLLYSKYNEEKFQKMVRNSKGFDFQDDLYEILQIDPSASLRDIRKQYNKLALAWHPDKNPTCGQECIEKFDKVDQITRKLLLRLQKLMKSLQIQNKEETMMSNGKNAGVFTPIKSKTVSLTTNNYRRLVEEGNDLWIIQIFEDGDRSSIALADLWEETANSFGGIIKFGRINVLTQYEVLRMLPYHIKIFPTILAIVPGYYAEIFAPSHRNYQIALKKFIESCIITNIDMIDHNGYFKLVQEWNTHTENIQPRRPEIALLTDKDQTPLSYRYASFKLHKFFKFYQNKFGEALKIKKTLGSKLPDMIVQVDQLKSSTEDIYTRKNFSFSFPKGLNNDKFRAIFEFTKFHTIPELDKSIYTEFCGGDENLIEDEDSKKFISFKCSKFSIEDEDNKPSVCVILLKNTTTDLKPRLRNINIFQKKNADDIFESIQSNTNFFDNYKYIRFGIIDTEKQKKFGRLIHQLVQKNGHAYPSALAIIHENQKYFVYDSKGTFSQVVFNMLENFGTFLSAIQKGSDSLESYYMSNILKERHITEFLFRAEENIFTFKLLWHGFLGWMIICLVMAIVHAYNEFL